LSDLPRHQSARAVQDGWVYERGKEPDQRATTVQGRENGYFEHILPDGSTEEVLESELAALEGECNDVVACARGELFDWTSTANRNRLAFYAAMLFARATQRRNFNSKHWLKIWQEFANAIGDDDFMNELAIHYASKFNIQVTASSLRDRLSKLVAKMQTPSEGKNTFLKDFLMHAEAIKTLLVQKPWFIWRAPPDIQFVTSDNPLISFLPLRNGEFHSGYGFRFPGVIAAFPLAPDACLAIGAVAPELQKLDTAGIRKLNEVTIRLCDRYVYSQMYSEEVTTLVNECGGTARYGETAYLHVGLNLPVKDFIRRHLGLDDRGDA
jgi:hypothetical protein